MIHQKVLKKMNGLELEQKYFEQVKDLLVDLQKS